MADNKFANGIYLKTPHENAPEFVKRKVSIKVDDFVNYLQENVNEAGYVNFDLKEAPTGHWYMQLDDWVKPDNQNSEFQADSNHSSPPNNHNFPPPPPPPGSGKFEDDVPF